jgi:hypothetical protein
MKRIIAVIGIVLAACSLPGGEVDTQWPGEIVGGRGFYAIPKDLALPEGLDERSPEKFDWISSIMERGQSTIEERELALQACSVLWKRLLEVEAECHATRLKSGGPEYAAKFDQMQKQWRALCAADCVDFAGPPGVYKGSGYKAYFPMFVAELIQERIKWLKVER